MDEEDDFEHRYQLWQRGYWDIPKGLDTSQFNFDWRPDPYDKPYIHVFGTQWQPSGGPRFIIPENLGYKFQKNQIAKKLPTKQNWIIPDLFSGEFDYSWHHDEFVEPIHAINYEWKCGVRYIHPDAVDTIYLTEYDNIKQPIYGKFYSDDIDGLVEKQTNNFWILNPYCNYNRFDFVWKPKTIKELRYINVFGNEHTQDHGTKFINLEMYKRGYKDYNYVNNVNFFLDTTLDIFYIDHSNHTSESNFTILKQRYPNINKVRFFDNWVDTVTRCVKKAKTPLIWVVSSYYNYSNFNFDYYPAPWDQTITHIFGTQWNEWGKTFLLNCSEWQHHKNLKEIEHLPSIKIIDKRTKIVDSKYDILFIDFGNDHNFTKATYHVPYQGSYLKTIDYWLHKESYLKSKKNYAVWVCSSICDYSNFDFTFEPLPFDEKQLHVFGSIYKNKHTNFGDTFLLNVHEFSTVKSLFTDLEQYTSKIKFMDNYVPRVDHPVIKHQDSCHITAITDVYEYFPYIQVTNNYIEHDEIMTLWGDEPIKSSEDSSSVYIPSVAILSIKNDMYDYPYLEKPIQFMGGKPLDIVYISNGEPNAEEHYEHLSTALSKSKAKNRLVRVENVNGRVAAYHAAAHASETNWFFAVFAKLRINPNFDWRWQPDRLQRPKHYIFTAINPVNRLNYGHQAMIAYNKKLVLGNQGVGLDFTLDNEHEVININSGIAIYNTDPWTTWRTAFREAIKLQDLVIKNTDNNAASRLQRWCGEGIGENAMYSQYGANDGVAYYNEVNGEFDKLKLSYEWSWLRARFELRYL